MMALDFRRLRYEVHFDYSTQGLANMNRFVFAVIPEVYRTHRDMVHGFFVSRHVGDMPQPHCSMWLCYRILEDEVDACKRAVEDGLRVVMANSGHTHVNSLIETESAAFEPVLGPNPKASDLHVLWVEIEHATLQAYHTFECPGFFRDWSHHVLRNVMGLE